MKMAGKMGGAQFEMSSIRRVSSVSPSSLAFFPVIVCAGQCVCLPLKWQVSIRLQTTKRTQ